MDETFVTQCVIYLLAVHAVSLLAVHAVSLVHCWAVSVIDFYFIVFGCLWQYLQCIYVYTYIFICVLLQRSESLVGKMSSGRGKGNSDITYEKNDCLSVYRWCMMMPFYCILLLLYFLHIFILCNFVWAVVRNQSIQNSNSCGIHFANLDFLCCRDIQL